MYTDDIYKTNNYAIFNPISKFLEYEYIIFREFINIWHRCPEYL